MTILSQTEIGLTHLPRILKKFLPFWLFLTFFKFGGGLHYSILVPLGEKIMPLWFVGAAIGASALIQLFLDVPAGYLLDKYGYKKLLKITTLLFLVAALFFLFGLNGATFLLTLAASTFGWLFFGPGTNAYIINQAPKEAVGRFISSRDVFASIGIVLSSILIIFAVNFDPRVVGLILIAIFISAYAAVALSPEDKILHPDEQAASAKASASQRKIFDKNILKESYQTIMRLRPASLMLISVGFSAAVFYGIIWFVVPLLIAHSVQNGILGLGLGVFDFSVVILGFFLGRIVDSFNKKILILIGLFIFSVAGILLGLDFGFLFLFLGFLATAGDELTGLSLWAWLYNIDKKHESYGLISGAIGIFEDLGWTVGPVLAGILYGLIGPSLTIATGGLLIFANLIIFYFFMKHPLPQTSELLLPHRPSRKRHKK